MKNKTGGAIIKESVGLKLEMYSFLVDDSSRSEYKGVLLNKKMFETFDECDSK